MLSIEERIIAEGKYICETGATVRKTANVFGVSKSCVHKDVSHKLRAIDKELFFNVERVLKFNFAEKHIRGGNATKLKYLKRIE